MNTSLACNKFLQDRAQLFSEARAFFANRRVMEVDCPALSVAAPVDLHIDVMRVDQMGYLHTSPEYGMKRLLSQGSGDIYQISHVFRRGEIGPLHNPEFTMAEWYRCGFTFDQMIEETLDFIRLFLGPLPNRQITYRDAFIAHLGQDPFTATIPDLLSLARHLDLPPDSPSWDKDTLLQLLVTFMIEPHLTDLTVLSYFPPTQAALASTATVDGLEVACRFEVYYRGIELANGYAELTDPIEQQRRLELANTQRLALGKSPLPIDASFLEALTRGLPDCCGVAVGFDRLMMLRHNLSSLDPILPFR